MPQLTSQQLYQCIEQVTKMADLLAAVEQATSQPKTPNRELEIQEKLDKAMVSQMSDRELYDFIDVMKGLGKRVLLRCEELIQNWK